MTSTAYALNRQHALNKDVRLITGLYGIHTRPQALRTLGHRAYISGKALLPVL